MRKNSCKSRFSPNPAGGLYTVLYRVSHRDSSWISKGLRDLGRPRRLQSGREYFYDRYLSFIFIPSHPGVLAPRTERSRARNLLEIPRLINFGQKLWSTIRSPTVIKSIVFLNKAQGWCRWIFGFAMLLNRSQLFFEKIFFRTFLFLLKITFRPLQRL